MKRKKPRPSSEGDRPSKQILKQLMAAYKRSKKQKVEKSIIDSNTISLNEQPVKVQSL